MSRIAEGTFESAKRRPRANASPAPLQLRSGFAPYEPDGEQEQLKEFMNTAALTLCRSSAGVASL